ncbi:cartilage intermediate layer protein 2-like [Ciona intestinalis]
MTTVRQSFDDPTTAPQVCGSQWTIWLDRDDPGGHGDDESRALLLHEYPHIMCAQPVAIEARLVDGRPATMSGNNVTMSPEAGLVCRNDIQPHGIRCHDFQVRFLCLENLI